MMNEPSESAIAHRLTVGHAVRIYQECEREIRECFARIAEAERRLNETFALASTAAGISVTDSRGRAYFSEPERNLVEVRTAVWRALIERLELRRMMSISRAKELDRQLDAHELPEITEANVSAVFESFRRALPDMLAEAVCEVFDWLRPPGSEYKRNSELEVPERVALTSIVEVWTLGSGSPFRVKYHRSANLTALENVFSALDGRGQITKSYRSEIENVIASKDFRGKGETTYFEFRAYKNGALHLRFKRLDLLARFNQIAGGKRLRPKAA